jgi:transketolase
VVRDGADLTIIATGAIVHAALEAAGLLGRSGIAARVLSMHTLKPIDRAAIAAAVRETGAVVTVEEHSLVGGLGSAVAEVIADDDLRPRAFRRLGLSDAFTHAIGGRDHLLRAAGLDASGIAASVRGVLRTVPA